MYWTSIFFCISDINSGGGAGLLGGGSEVSGGGGGGGASDGGGDAGGGGGQSISQNVEGGDKRWEGEVEISSRRLVEESKHQNILGPAPII